MIGAGDIAVCGASWDEATARLVDSVLTADTAKAVNVVFTAGDNAYPSGSGGVMNYFPRCFSPSWGRERIMELIRPSPGNHDYDSGSGAPYFAYFGDRAGPPRKRLLQLRRRRMARDRAQQRALLLARDSRGGERAGGLAAQGSRPAQQLVHAGVFSPPAFQLRRSRRHP